MPKRKLHTIALVQPVLRHSPHNTGTEVLTTYLGTSISPAGPPRPLEPHDTICLDIELPNIDVTAYESGRAYKKLFFLVRPSDTTIAPSGLHRLEFTVIQPTATVSKVVNELLNFIAPNQRRPRVDLQPNVKRSVVRINEVSSLSITVTRLGSK